MWKITPRLQLMDTLLGKNEGLAGPQSTLTAKLRILETTDLHMQILAFDYFTGEPTPGKGLIPLVSLIEAHRSNPTVSTLLFDNGDFLQGNPLADHLVNMKGPTHVHPMIAAMNSLAYDAVGLGNHEFTYGLPFLQSTLEKSIFPTVCANVTLTSGTPFLPPYVMIDKEIICNDGQTRTVKVGVIGLVTPQLASWERAILEQSIQTFDIVEVAADLAPKMRAEGAEIIVALCHSGIMGPEWDRGMENAAVPLAGLPDIDVVLTGHTHDQFPNTWGEASAEIDPVAGMLHGKPTVMAGFYGSHLGVIELDLSWNDTCWEISQSKTWLEQSIDTALSGLQQEILAIVTPSHEQTLHHIKQPIVKTKVPINSHFATIAPNLSLELLADAQSLAIEIAGQNQDWGELPIISAVAPFRAGARGGPFHYVDIDAGKLTLKDASAIYPFSNQLYAMRRSGAQIAKWLEKVAQFYATVKVGTKTQQLTSGAFPPYCYDIIYGLTYEFDISVPTNRLRNLCLGGVPVLPKDQFVLATNSYRANGGGGYFTAPDEDVLYRSTLSTRDILIDTLRQSGAIDRAPREVWRFTRLTGTHAQFRSAPHALPPAGSRISATGKSDQGFAVFDIAL